MVAERKGTDSQERSNPARRTLLTGGAAGLAAMAGATFGRAQPASAGDLTGDVTWILPSGDTSGAADTKAIQDALNLLNPQAIALLSPGEFYIKESTAGNPAISLTYGQCLRGSNNTLLMYKGNTACIFAHSSDQGGPLLQNYPQNVMGPEISYLTIDGSQAGANAVGLDVGDADDGFVWRVRTANFTGATQYGMLIINRFFYTEKWRIYTQHFNCYNPVTIGSEPANGGTNSFMYNDFEFHINALQAAPGSPATQNGVALGAEIQGVTYGHCGLDHGRLCIRGNWLVSDFNGVQNPSFVLALGTTAAPNAAPHIDGAIVDIAVETDPNQSNDTPTTILWNNSGTSMTNCTGRLVFGDGWTPSSPTANINISFGGPIVGDSNLIAANTVPPSGWL